MKQPFEIKHIRRYLLMYAGIVIVMALFYIVNSANNPIESVEKKVFSTTQSNQQDQLKISETPSINPAFRLLDKSY